jgi:hypothetical protein
MAGTYHHVFGLLNKALEGCTFLASYDVLEAEVDLLRQ